MAYQISTYRGDAEYSISCAGDCVTGDEVRFERATFSGSFRHPKFDGFERVTGKIVSDSYGDAKQQHTFTLELANGSRLLIKGRNLYSNGVFRKLWSDEGARRDALTEKHTRGDHARAARAERLELAL